MKKNGKPKRLLSLVMAVIMLLCVAPVGKIDADAATYDPNIVVNLALSKVGGYGGENICLTWVKDLFYEAYGFSSISCCAYHYGVQFRWSASKDNIPLGADVFFSGMAYGYDIRCKNGGVQAGHIGVYVGNGYIVSDVGGKIRKDSIDSVVSWGYNYYGWGWHGGVSLQSHSHSYSSSITKQPTCTASGVRTYRCSCGASYTENIASLGHSYKTTTVPVSVNADGYTIKECTRCGNNEKTNVVKKPELSSDGWYYCSAIPNDLDKSKATIQYNNHYEKIASSSPGSDWKLSQVIKDEWRNVGSPVYSLKPQATSNSYILADRYYFHFCGPNTPVSTYSDWTQGGAYVHYDSVPFNSVSVRYTKKDYDDPSLNQYYLKWNSNGSAVYCQSGVTCDGSYGGHGARSDCWYIQYVYQQRERIVQNKYVKDSGWVNSKDNSASSIKYRWYIEKPTVPENPDTPDTPNTPDTPDTPSQTCNHICHSGGILWAIIRFFCKIFKTNQFCTCGAAHY